ncbi:hypothetical protein CTI12_AA457280 [Artemisia annua]|uniref:Uncharacterized protein n=1 Tax=Artemisia annua TaxID=35608 RepID=A0A2U1LT41_ARTAN|nr:hypothetical protein CTI12_AA457280 [Artemisia annua]
MASSKEETLARMFEKIALKNYEKKCSKLDSVKTTVKHDDKVVDGETQETNISDKEPVDDGKSSNVNPDDKSFSSSSYEEGQSSKDIEDDFDPSPIIDWLRLNVGGDEECQKLLNSLQTKIDKANEMISQLRAMGHDIDDDYLVDINFFDDE